MSPPDPAGERPPREVVAELLQGAWVCQAISVACRLDVPDILQAYGPLTAEQITNDRRVDANPELLHRVLRACASVGVFSEDSEGRFGHTALSEVLTLDSLVSLKRFAELYGGRWWRSFGELLERVKGGQSRPTPLESFTSDPEQMQRFGEAMKLNVRLIPELLAKCELSGPAILVDVGGGFGHMSIALLKRLPQFQAVVLDLPEVVAAALDKATQEDLAIRERLTFVAGDMFVDTPTGSVFLLSRILHDWGDEGCIQILRNCRARLSPRGRIICLDSVLPQLGDLSGAPAKFLDLLMLASLPGKERTEAEWRQLFGEAGFTVTSIELLDPRTNVSVVEGVCV